MNTKITKILSTALILFYSLFATAAEIKEGRDGMYWKIYDSYTFFLYQVDTITETCFSAIRMGNGGSGLTKISCRDLAKRQEWGKIITWVEKK